MADQVSEPAAESAEAGGTSEPPFAPAASTAPSTGGLTPEKALDVLLGAAVVAAEGVQRTARQWKSDAPGVVGTLEEKGRPLREKILGQLNGATNRMASQATTAANGASSSGGAEADITALEKRVRELEQQLAGDVASEPSPPHTTAEDATFVPGEDAPPPALADSPYAVSETDEEATREADDESRGDESR